MSKGQKRRTRETQLAKAQDWRAFTREFQGESDRAAAVLGAAWLDARLERLLSSFLVDDHNAVEPLFDVQGPLGGFSSHVRMAYALGLISRAAFDDLLVIRDIRNKFAHNLHGESFATPEVASECGRLQVPWFRRDPDSWPPGGYSNARTTFELAVGALAVVIGDSEESTAVERRRVKETEAWPAGRRTRR